MARVMGNRKSRDGEHKVSYIDVGNPIDVKKLSLMVRNIARMKKEKIKVMTVFLRDKMATAVYHLIARHTMSMCRKSYEVIEQYF